jgi:hypothetical protein
MCLTNVTGTITSTSGVFESAPVTITLAGQSASTSTIGRVPRRITDALPPLPLPVPLAAIPKVTRRVILHVRDSFRTCTNYFGVFREYLYWPSYDPDAHITLDDLANFPVNAASSGAHDLVPASGGHRPPWPLDNMSKYLLMSWAYTGSNQKSEKEVAWLALEVICHKDFRLEDLLGFDTHQEKRRFDKAMATVADSTPFETDDWRETSVKIEIPVPVRGSSPRAFEIPGFHYRSIVQVIKAAWESPAFFKFHLTPFRRIHVDSAGNESRIFDEVYTSEAWELAHDQLQKQRREPGCKLEKIIAGLMLWSDSTHLAQFGTASLWPVYLYFANLSKYLRTKPNSGACNHIAYIPLVRSNAPTLRHFSPDSRSVAS